MKGDHWVLLAPIKQLFQTRKLLLVWSKGRKSIPNCWPNLAEFSMWNWLWRHEKSNSERIIDTSVVSDNCQSQAIMRKRSLCKKPQEAIHEAMKVKTWSVATPRCCRCRTCAICKELHTWSERTQERERCM